MLALRDAREVYDMLAIAARGLGRDFRRNCVAYELRQGQLRPVAASAMGGGIRSPLTTDSFDLDVIRLRVVVRRDGEDLIAVSADGQVRAILVIENAVAPLTDDELKHLRVLGAHLSLALASGLAFEQLRRYAAEGAALVDAARTILSVTELEPLASVLCRLGMRLAVAQLACVYGRRDGRLVQIGRANAPGFPLGPDELPIDEVAARSALAAAFESPFVASRLMIRADDAVEGAQPGLLVVARTRPFEKSDQRLLDALVTLAALAIRNVELYETTIRTSRALGESNAFKDDLMAMFAHDFRGPLTVISGFSELLADHADAAVRNSSNKIVEQTGRLAKLSDDALALAATQSAGFSLQRASDDLTEFVRDAASALDRDERIVVEAPSEPTIVSFDRNRLRHAIDNVVGNALKYSSGAVVVRIVSLAAGARIDVVDRGIGIPAPEVDRVFVRFGRATNARSRGISGSGVGLYIAKKIVDVHGGSLTVASVENEGSTFSIHLPLE